METHKASLGLKSFILNFAKGVFPNLTPLLLTSLSHCSQIHAGSSVVYTLAHAPKERVILCFFFTPAFKAYQCDLCLYIFLNFETLFLPPEGSSCAIKADCVLPAICWVWNLGCLLQYSSCQQIILVLTVFER